MSRLQRALHDSASAAQPGGGAASASASQPGVSRAEKLLQQVRQLGYYPRENRNDESGLLAQQLRRAVKAGLFDAAQLAELEGFRKCAADQLAKAKSQTLVDEVLNLGYLPRENRREDSKLARQIRKARNICWFDSTQLAQLAAVQIQRVHPKTAQQQELFLDEAGCPCLCSARRLEPDRNSSAKCALQHNISALIYLKHNTNNVF